MTIHKRDKYEREFIKIVMDNDDKIYGQRGTHTDGVDIILFKKDRAWLVEVKTSESTKRYFTPKMLEQYGRYIDLYNKYNISVWYAFRVIDNRKIDKMDKWTMYHVTSLPRNRNNKVYLTNNTFNRTLRYWINHTLEVIE